MRRAWLALVLCIPIPAAIFLAQDGFFASSDGMIHLYRLCELDRAIHAGIFYPRWFPLSGYGYGLAVLNYYPPLAYYLAELFHLAGAGYIVSIKLLIAFSFAAAAFSMFLFARDLLDDLPAFVAAVAYAYLPYLLSDAYVRGNFPELLAMSLLPLALFFFRRLFAGGGRGNLAGAALSFAAIILTHHLTAMSFAALLLAYLAFLFLQRREVARLLACIAALAIALTLSLFFWLPAIAELDLVYVGPGSLARFLVNRLVDAATFFQPSLAYAYLPQSEVLKHAAGFPQTVLALLTGVVGIALFFRGRRMGSSSRFMFHALFFLLLLVASMVMMLDISAPLWYAVPTLRFMQFPWRFQVLAGIAIAFLLGAGFKWIADTVTKFNAPTVLAAISCAALIALGVANLPVRTFALSDAQLNLARSNDSDYVVAQMGWGWTREFVPATTQEVESIFGPAVKTDSVSINPTLALPAVRIEEDGLVSHALRVSTDRPIDISLHTFFFPVWQAYVDGVPARTFPRGTLGLASVTVPPGDHAVLFRFEDTPLRAASTWVSLAAFAVGLVWLAVTRRRVAFALVAALIVVAAAWAWHTRGASSKSAQPIAIAADLDRRAMLVGYATDRANYRAGDTIYLTLYWFAVQEMDADYYVSVQLIDTKNVTVAQQDGPTDQGLTPTTHWLSGEIVTDHHALAAVAPGDYRLSVSMYLPLDNGFENLGSPIDLATVQVTR
ncbi:MAG: hypothetical protein KGJ80_01220 [Chloroflexota bacterium]|nr:hypothetical protein [Chloroflexota bacterium]